MPRVIRGSKSLRHVIAKELKSLGAYTTVVSKHVDNADLDKEGVKNALHGVDGRLLWLSKLLEDQQTLDAKCEYITKEEMESNSGQRKRKREEMPPICRKKKKVSNVPFDDEPWSDRQILKVCLKITKITKQFPTQEYFQELSLLGMYNQMITGKGLYWYYKELQTKYNVNLNLYDFEYARSISPEFQARKSVSPEFQPLKSISPEIQPLKSASPEIQPLKSASPEIQSLHSASPETPQSDFSWTRERILIEVEGLARDLIYESGNCPSKKELSRAKLFDPIIGIFGTFDQFKKEYKNHCGEELENISDLKDDESNQVTHVNEEFDESKDVIVLDDDESKDVTKKSEKEVKEIIVLDDQESKEINDGDSGDVTNLNDKESKEVIVLDNDQESNEVIVLSD